MKKIISVFFIIALLSGLHNALAQSNTRKYTIEPAKVIDMTNEVYDYGASLLYKSLPKPHPGTDAATITSVKQQLEKYRKTSANKSPVQNKIMSADPPLLVRNFAGNTFTGFVPNDNDVAISNHDVVCSVTNSSVWSRDQANNLNYGTFSLHSLTASLGLQQEEFDPKVLFDPVSKRFILVCLNGFSDSTSNILVGFSQDSISFGSWNFYSLPGDPLNNNLWTDFPMMAVSGDELFITVNLLYNDSTWQAGFNQTVIWQINKNEGYNGNTLNPLLHYDIKHNNEPLRNLCPAKGGSTLYGPNMYFLSNRNFALENDTIFLVEVTGAINNPPPAVNITPLTSGLSYRMPIDAQQTSTDLLIVNDARILGAFYENDLIQFVSNMLDTATGKTAIYHGLLELNPTPVLNANLYSVDSIYLAYPNIAYAGTSPGDISSVVSVLLSSTTIHPGTSAFRYDATGMYSPLTTVKAGSSYTNMLAGNERWGDYTGCQTHFGTPGTVWVNGSYSIVNHTTRTWIGELSTLGGTGIAEAADSPLMEVYPNPNLGEMTIEFEMLFDGMLVIDVADITGKKTISLYKGNIRKGKNEFRFSTAKLGAGNYVLVARRSDGFILNKKSFTKN